MIKRMLLCFTALAALTALAAPAAQGALLTNSKEVAVELNAEITMTSSDLTMTVPGLPIICKAVTVHGFVAENSPEVQIPITNAEVGSCEIKGIGVLVNVTEPAFGTLELVEGKGWMNPTFKYDILAAGLSNCHFEGGAALVYESGSDELTMPGSLFGAGTSSPGCPTTGTTHGSFKLEDASGSVTID